MEPLISICVRPTWVILTGKVSNNKNGMLLKDLPEEMKGDRELCTAAVALGRKKGLLDSTIEQILKGLGVPEAVLCDVLTT